jgi:uncharacterized protein
MSKDLEKELRVYHVAELRVEGDEKPKITGYAAVFDKRSDDLGGFTEYVRSGCFSKTIRESDIKALYNHDPNYVLGRNKAGTLKLDEDAVGLRMSIDPPDTQWARDLMTSIKRGDVDQCSFGFKTVKDAWRTEDGMNCRDLLECRLFDVSVVTNPAYPQTSAQVRAKVESLNTDPDEPVKPDHSAGEPEKNLHSSQDRLRVIRMKQVLENVDLEVK